MARRSAGVTGHRERVHPRGDRLVVEQPAAERVHRGDRELLVRAVDRLLEPAAQLVGRGGGEGQREDGLGGHALLDQPREARHQRARLAGSRARHDEQRAAGMGDGLELGGGEAIEHGGHAPRIRADAAPPLRPRRRLARGLPAGGRGPPPGARRQPDHARARRGDRAAARAATCRSSSTARPRTSSSPCSTSSTTRASASSPSPRSAARSTTATPACAWSSIRSTARSTPSATCRTTRSRSPSPTGRRWPMSPSATSTTTERGRSGWLGAERGRPATAPRSTRRQRSGATTRAGSRSWGSSPPIRAGSPRRPRRWPELASRLRAVGSIAVSLCQVAAARFDGMVSLRRCRSFDAAAAQLIVREAGGHVVFPACDEPLGALLDLAPRSPVVAARSERGLAELAILPRLTRRAGEAVRHHGSGDRLDPRRAARRRHRRRRRASAARRGPARDGRRGPAPRHRLHRARARRRAAAARDRRPPGVGPGQPAIDPPGPRPGRRSDGRRAGPAAYGGAYGHGLPRGRRGGRGHGLPGPAGAGPVRARPPRSRGARRGCSSSRRTSTRPPARLGADRASSCAGSRCTRSRTRSSSRASRGCASTSPSCCASCSRPSRCRSTPRALLRLPDRSDLDALVAAVREGDLISLAVGPEQRALLDRMQAIMAVIEGHAEHVMDAVGAEVLPSLPQLRAGFERRRASRSAPGAAARAPDRPRAQAAPVRARQALLRRRRRRGRIPALNAVWRAPDAIPTAAELEDPHAWLARTNVPYVTK